MKTISVFGVFVADLCFISNAIPEKGQTILGSQHIIGPGGKGSNQAIAAAKLNGSVNFITKIGKDKNGEMALTLYKELGIDTACIIQDENHSTGVAGIMVNEKTVENAINIIPGAAGTITHDDIEKTKEFEITIKSKLEFKDYLIEFLNKNSTYDVPQIIYKKYHAEMKYYDWLNKTI